MAVAVRGDITGDIDCGQVFRIDAQVSADGTFGGVIFGNITTHTSNGFVVPSSASVGFVRAGRGIAGAIAAPADFYNGGFADIARVVVGPATGGQGIGGDILAPFGNIGSVLTTGPIGTAAGWHRAGPPRVLRATVRRLRRTVLLLSARLLEEHQASRTLPGGTGLVPPIACEGGGVASRSARIVPSKSSARGRLRCS